MDMPRWISLGCILLCIINFSLAQETANFRPPAVPLVIQSPYFSIWSFADHLYDTTTSFWAGERQALTGLIRIDGKPYYFMGAPLDNSDHPTLLQTNLTVDPTQTIYTFGGAGVQLVVTFTSCFSGVQPLDLDMFSRPINYITFAASSLDGGSHVVDVAFYATGEIVAVADTEAVQWSRKSNSNLHIVSMGTVQQPVLLLTMDTANYDWGYLYLATPKDSASSAAMASWSSVTQTFMASGNLPKDSTRQPRHVQNDWPTLATAWTGLKVSPGNVASKYVILMYDEVGSIQWFGTPLIPYWRNTYSDAVSMLNKAQNDYTKVIKQSASYDTDLNSKLTAVGGVYYQKVAALIFRQTFGATDLVWHPTLKEAWYFMKEQSSCGCLSTVDVIFPAAPQFMYLSPELLKMQMLPHYAYGNNETFVAYDRPYAQHHLGVWPVGQLLPFQQEDMPMEESGNLLMMTAFVAKQLGDTSFFYPQYWKMLTGWAEYLNSTLPFPPSQLCTNDFEGPTANDTTLAAKGIIGMGAYAMLADMVGESQVSTMYTSQARKYVDMWMENAYQRNPIKHYVREFGLPNSWSIKFNLAWQNFLGLDLFPQEVMDAETEFYMTKVNQYGVPMDDRKTFTMPPWEIMGVLLSEDKVWERQAMIKLIYDYINNTPNRVPVSDWYDTVNAQQVGFQARPVNGALFAPMVLGWASQV